MNLIDPKDLEKLYKPDKNSHKGQNGKLLLVGGSELFHAASMWSLEIASRIVDMVFYASVPVNEEIVKKQKERFGDGIVVPEGRLEEYLQEADCVLIGPGMERNEQTAEMTNGLLGKNPNKKWVIDGGALQMMDKNLLTASMIVTPHHREFEVVFGQVGDEASTAEMAKKYNCTIVLKGEKDVISNGQKTVVNVTGNVGMTKGGTGDVLAGLIGALYCKNEAFLAASAGAYLNGLAGDRLHKKVGRFYNASDLVKELTTLMGEVL